MNRLGLLITVLVLLANSGFSEDPKKPQLPLKPTNRLAKESSPYLLQHAHNPVDWYPWGEEAFAKAKKDGKLIFLSIGYSACHWCHVMEKESFSDEKIAKILNEHFVCIKLDREERPDVDDVYMMAVQVTGVSGGWPLNVFLTPEGKPIFGGTYFPPQDKKVEDGTINGFPTILQKVIELHRDKKEELYAQADVVAEKTAEALERATPGAAIIALNRELVIEVTSQFDLDPVHGGLGNRFRQHAGTKFPRVSALQFLLQQSATNPDTPLAKNIQLSLAKMAEGGIYDQLGGGFHRYSTERTWTVPHFEKMLYDNAQLLELYAMAYQLNPSADLKQSLEETVQFLVKEMRSPEGGFYSALDADSNGKEGEYYVWTRQELDTLLGDTDEAKLFRQVYSVGTPNFEGKYSILRRSKSWALLAKDANLSREELLQKLAPLQEKLRQVRAKRERPFLDTKIITSWNGQTIAGLAKTGQVLQDKKILQLAQDCANFVLKELKNDQNRLSRIFAAKPGKQPKSQGQGFLEDYAFLIHGLLALHDATQEKRWLTEAEQLQKAQEQWFSDPKNGGYFSTPNDGEKLFARGKDAYDGAQPSGNGIALHNLYQLWRKTKNPEYQKSLNRCFKTFAGVLKLNPTSLPWMAYTLHEYLMNADVAAMSPTKEEKPKVENPKKSADVVAVKVTATGKKTFHLEAPIEGGWHFYAHENQGGEEIEESRTTVEVVNGMLLLKPNAIDYPNGKPQKNTLTGEYAIYEKQVTIVVELAEEAPLEKLQFRVRVVACNDKICLLPSTIIAEVSKK